MHQEAQIIIELPHIDYLFLGKRDRALVDPFVGLRGHNFLLVLIISLRGLVICMVVTFELAIQLYSVDQ